MHQNIVTALLSDITARSLDVYFGKEEDFASQSVGTAVNECKSLLELDKGTVLDKTRALLCLYLAQPQVNAQQLSSLTDILTRLGGDTSSLKFLRQMTSLSNPQHLMQPEEKKEMPKIFGGLADKLLAQGTISKNLQKCNKYY